MSEVLVRNLDESVVEQLKTRARGNGRSLQAELKLILEQAARPETSRPSLAGVPRTGGTGPCHPGNRPQADSAALPGRGPGAMSVAMGWPGTPPTCLIVDANVVIKWHVAEVHSDAALRWLGDDVPALHVPDLVFPEVGNILWKKVRRGDLTGEEARRIGHLVAMVAAGGAPLGAVAGVGLGDRHAYRAYGLR